MLNKAPLSGYCAVAMATVGTIFEPDAVMGCAHLLTSTAGARSKNNFSDVDIMSHFSKLSNLIFFIFSLLKWDIVVIIVVQSKFPKPTRFTS